MKTLLLLCAILAVWGPLSVHGATCSDLTSNICEETYFTTSTCDSSKVCGCIDGYLPIRTGCGKKLVKPVVSLDHGRTNEVITGAKAQLTCSSTDTFYSAASVSYEWKKDGTKVSTETRTHTFTATAADDVGAFSCAIKLTDPDLAMLSSEESETMTIIYVDADAKSNSVPKITGVPDKAANGSAFTPSCTNLPYGATHSFTTMKEGGATVEGLTIITFDPETQDKVKCVLDLKDAEYFTTAESEPVDMPVVATDIDSATISLSGAVGTEYVYNTNTNPLIVVCATNPEAFLMNVSPMEVTFAFEDSAKDNPSFDEDIGTYPLLPNEGRHEISCNATYSSTIVPATPARIVVTFSNDYITTPQLTASGTSLVAGSRLVLACGSAQSNVAYLWRKGNHYIIRQFDHILQIDSFTADDAGEYMCIAQKNNYRVDSNKITITFAEGISETKVERMRAGTTFGTGGDYVLKCVTNSTTTGMTYTWKKDTTDLESTTSTYAITNASDAEHSGTYSCTATFNTMTSTDHNPLDVQIVAAGKECTTANAATECKGYGYEGSCTTGDLPRCECSEDYVAKGDGCAYNGTDVTDQQFLAGDHSISPLPNSKTKESEIETSIL